MLRVEEVATPFTAVTIFVPESVPPLGFVPRATVTEPVKLGSVVPASFWAATFTAGEIGLPATVALGWTVNTRCVAGGGGGGAAPGLSATTIASQLLGDVKFQVHRGSTVPALACTAVSAWSTITWLGSDCLASIPKPGEVWEGPTKAFDIVTAY